MFPIHTKLNAGPPERIIGCGEMVPTKYLKIDYTDVKMEFTSK